MTIIRRKIHVFLSVVLLAGPAASQANVFGVDDRTEKFYDVPVHRKILFIEGGCTGALIGRNLVLTAAHCLKFKLGVDGQGHFHFKGNYHVYAKYRGQSYEAAAGIRRAWWGDAYFGRHGSAKDWAILEIDQNFGDAYGYFEVLPELSPGDPANSEIWTAGFNGDLSLPIGNRLTGPDKTKAITQHEDNLLLHLMPTSTGASGAPLWKSINGADTIVGLQVAALYSGLPAPFGFVIDKSQDWNLWANIAVNPRVFSQRVREILARESPPDRCEGMLQNGRSAISPDMEWAQRSPSDEVINQRTN